MAHRVTCGCRYRDLPQGVGRCSPCTTGIPHHHKSPPPRQRWGLSLVGVCEHLHVFTAFPQMQERVVLIREWSLWVQAASLETRDEYSPDNRHSQLVLTYPPVILVSMHIAGGATKPMPSWPCSAGLSRPGFQAVHLHQHCRLTGRKHGESALVPSSRKTLVCGSKTLSLSWTPESIFNVPILQPVEFLLLVLIQPSCHPVHLCLGWQTLLDSRCTIGRPAAVQASKFQLLALQAFSLLLIYFLMHLENVSEPALS